MPVCLGQLGLLKVHNPGRKGTSDVELLVGTVVGAAIRPADIWVRPADLCRRVRQHRCDSIWW